MPDATIGTVPTVTYNARTLEVPDANWFSGVEAGSLNAPGIGVNMGGGAVIGTPEQFTLLDQFGTARVAQASSCLGAEGLTASTDWPGSGGQPKYGPGIEIESCTPADSSGDGTITVTGTANLQTLGAGWVPTAV